MSLTYHRVRPKPETRQWFHYYCTGRCGLGERKYATGQGRRGHKFSIAQVNSLRTGDIVKKGIMLFILSSSQAVAHARFQTWMIGRQL